MAGQGPPGLKPVSFDGIPCAFARQADAGTPSLQEPAVRPARFPAVMRGRPAMSKRFLTAAAMAVGLGLSTLSLSACGGDDTTVVKPQTTSRGQQLLDLQRAYENGAISRKEYEHEREKVLKEK